MTKQVYMESHIIFYDISFRSIHKDNTIRAFISIFYIFLVQTGKDKQR